MTRINLVPPRELADQHLFAEFREIKMIPPSLRRSLVARGSMGVYLSIPAAYTLGKGHVSFFYDKGMYLVKRYEEIRKELNRRKINYNKDALFDPEFTFTKFPILCRNYVPTEAALALIRARIAEKIAMKPDWYRWTSA